MSLIDFHSLGVADDRKQKVTSTVLPRLECFYFLQCRRGLLRNLCKQTSATPTSNASPHHITDTSTL